MSSNGFGQLQIDGRIATPGDDDWDEARQAWNLAADPHPAAVAFVEAPGDIAAVIGFARDNDLRVLGQGTGHGAVAVGPCEDTIILKTERMRGIEIDPDARTARFEAGVLAMDLAAAAQPHGLSYMPGSSPDVGVTGFTLGGGLSWFARRHGFACNRVTAVEVVTAAGEELRVTAETDAELFWALRGGGGSYAIVTALHVSLLPIADVYAGALVFPAELGTDAVRAYRDWARELPDEVTSIVRFLRPPPLPDVPEPIRDRPLLTIGAACIADQAEGERLIAPMRALGEPIMDMFSQMPSEGLCRIHMDPEQPVPGVGHHVLVSELSDEAIDAFYGDVGPESGSPLLVAEMRQLGGAAGRPAEDGGALDHVDAEFAMLAVGLPMTPELGAAIESRLDSLERTLAPWRADGGYFNFAERPCDVDAIFDAATCARLAEVKRTWDQDGVIRANHALAPAPA